MVAKADCVNQISFYDTYAPVTCLANTNYGMFHPLFETMGINSHLFSLPKHCKCLGLEEHYKQLK